MKADLETRIADAIGAVLPSTALASLLDEVAAADKDAEAASIAANERALDPATKPADVAKARKDAEDADFSRRRMDRAKTALSEQLAKAKGRERAEVQRRELEAAAAERDQLIIDLAEYDELSRKIAALLVRLDASNARVGVHHSAEIAARQTGDHWIVNIEEALPKLLEMTRLPKFRRDGTNIGYLWPKRTW